MEKEEETLIIQGGALSNPNMVAPKQRQKWPQKSNGPQNHLAPTGRNTSSPGGLAETPSHDMIPSHVQPQRVIYQGTGPFLSVNVATRLDPPLALQFARLLLELLFLQDGCW